MADSTVPDDVRRFLHRFIDSVAQWEGLLVLKMHPLEAFDAETIAARLYVPEPEAAELLEQLMTRGLIAAEEDGERRRFRFRPDSIDLAGVVERAAYTYSRHLIDMTNIIHARPRDGVQAFANAFRLRKD